jgi:putative ABC transport system ATP-binding protein
MYSDPPLRVQGLTKDHGTGPGRVRALRGVDLEVAAGEFVALTGASGSGKSTLLHLVAGLDLPTAGGIWIGGADLASLSDDERTLLRRRQVGMIFQAFHLLDVFTAEENVAVPLVIAGRPRAEARRRAAALLDRVGLSGRRKHLPQELSGGEQQRVAIARALAVEPLLLLADEPTGNLDSAQGEQIVDLLRGLTDVGRHALLMVTHNPTHAARADRVLTLSDGRILEEARNSIAHRRMAGDSA